MSDMFAAADESSTQITDRYTKAWAHSDATIEAREWWRDYRDRVERGAREAAARG